METFLSTHEHKLKSLIYDVNYYEKNLKSLSSWWGRIALLGKINSLDVAATILDDIYMNERMIVAGGRWIRVLVWRYWSNRLTLSRLGRS